MAKEKEEEKEETLLQELCGADAPLYDFLSSYLYVNPLGAVSTKELDVLTEEAEKSGNFRPAVDKAIFEGAQNPAERERYVEVIQNLAAKTMHAMQQERERLEKEGLADHAASVGRRIENQRFMSERAEDILSTASKFYSEKLVELGERGRREVREEERKAGEREERRIRDVEKAGRQARKRARRGMTRAERREAKKQDKREQLAAEDRKGAREEARKEVATEERRIGEREKEEREARNSKRRAN